MFKSPTFSNISSAEAIFYPFNVSVNKCGGSCNTVDHSYALVCVPNKVNNMNVSIDFGVRSK